MEFAPDGFLPPPLLVEQTNLGYDVLDLPTETAKFCPFLLQKALNLIPKTQEFGPIPYDFACPSIQKSLPERLKF